MAVLLIFERVPSPKETMPQNSDVPRAGVLMVWCDRPVNPCRSPEWGTLDEVRVLARGYHYLCPLDYVELDIRGLSDAKDLRVVLKRCSKCGTYWHGPTLTQLRSRPAGASGPLTRCRRRMFDEP